MSDLKNITVNGLPASEFVQEQVGDEIRAHARKETSELRKIVNRRVPSRFRNTSGSKTAQGQVIYRAGQREVSVLILGTVFPWENKAPYVRSRHSILGGFEVNAAGEVKCHECGTYKHKLGSHVRKHRMTAAEYRARHGLHCRTGLCSKSQTEKRRAAMVGSPKVQASLAKLKLNIGRRAACVVASERSPRFSREMVNLQARCKAQLTSRIIAMSVKLGRGPSRSELEMGDSIGPISAYVIEGTFCLPWREALVSMGIKPTTAPSGFATMTPEDRRAACIKGGHAAQSLLSDEDRKAMGGRLVGTQSPEELSRNGFKGGKIRWQLPVAQ